MALHSRAVAEGVSDSAADDAMDRQEAVRVGLFIFYSPQFPAQFRSIQYILHIPQAAHSLFAGCLASCKCIDANKVRSSKRFGPIFVNTSSRDSPKVTLPSVRQAQ